MKQLLTTIAALILVGWGRPCRFTKLLEMEISKQYKQYLDGGADVNAKLKDGDTALDSAEYVHESDHSPVERAIKKETANLLRKHGGKTAEELKAIGN